MIHQETSQPEALKGVDLEQYLKGALAVRVNGDQLIPHRVDASWSVFLSDELSDRAFDPAGVRLCVTTDSTWIEVDVEPAAGVNPVESYSHWTFDWVCQGEIVHREEHPMGPVTLRIENLSNGLKGIELYLYQVGPIGIKAARFAPGSKMLNSACADSTWLFYGSSITQCGMAAGPAETWPAIVSREIGVEHWNLGYGGNCKVEPSVARMIRGLDVDVIVLELGINIQDGADYSYYTFISNMIGMIHCIREAHPLVPLICLSPLFCESREVDQPKPMLDLVKLRQKMQVAVGQLARHGDDRLIYINGMDLMGTEDRHYFSDGLHPTAEGYRLLAKRFTDQVVPIINNAMMS